MAGSATLATLDKVLKEYYLPPVVEQLNNEVLLLQRLEPRSQELFGKFAVVPVHTGRSTGIGARFEGSQLPDAGSQAYARATFDLKYLYGRVRVTGPSMVKTSSDAGSFLQALKQELDGIRNDLRKDTARQVYGNGDGVIATTAVNTTVSTLVLQSAEPLTKGQLYIGMNVDIGTAASPQSIVANTQITAVNLATPSITIGSSVTTAAGNIITRQGANANGSLTAEVTGLKQLVSTTAGTVVGGLDPAQTNMQLGGPWWENLRDTTVGALSMDRLMQAFNKQRVAGGEPSLLLTTFGIQRAYFNLFTQTTKFTEPTKLEGGYSALTFMDKPLVADVDAPFGNLYLLDERFLKVFASGDWQFLDKDGDTLKWTQNFDQWEAVLARYMNLGITRRNVQMVLSGIQVGGASDPGF